MGKAGHNAGFPLFSKPIGGKTTKHLRETTKHLVEITKDLGKTTRHLVFRGSYSGIWQVGRGDFHGPFTAHAKTEMDG